MCNGAFPLRESETETYTDSYSNEIYKGSTGTYSDDDTDAKLQCKSIKNYIIGSDISAKLGIVAICIGISTCIGLGVVSVETVLHIIIIAISIRVGVGLSLGVGRGQWKHTIRLYQYLFLHHSQGSFNVE